MHETKSSTTIAPGRGIGGALRRLGSGMHWLVLLTALGGFVAMTLPFLRAALQAKPIELPATLERVDWTDSGSSLYCVACHRQVAPAMAGLDVQRGHSQNVRLNDTQLQAVAALGTVAGPHGTLICMSCHRLGQPGGRFMLADTLVDSRLCQRCHPGHYAQGTPHDLRLSAPEERNRFGHTVAESGPCSACHLAHSFARQIVRSPLDPDGWCTNCHQDYQVAGRHARERMDHPESHCIQCHNPHDMTHGEFLRAPTIELCLRCHGTLAGGAAVGMHPLGKMDFPVPQELLDAGAQVGADCQEMTCATCHSTHKGQHQSLLLLERDSNRLCLACHKDKLLGPTGDGVLPRHGQSPILTAAQQAVVATFGNRVGPNNELLCVSCHRVHGGLPARSLLTFKPKYGETCVECHPSQATVFGTSHDLLTNFPDERNSAGLTPASSGTCSACHLAHGFPRERVVAPGDPGGECVSCHRLGAVGQNKCMGPPEHPKTKCSDCHNPHDRHFGNYLSKAEVGLCGGCHADQSKLVGGPHDFTQPLHFEKLPPTANATPAGVCRVCHVPHGGAGPGLFRVDGLRAGDDRDRVCDFCHPDAAWGSATGVAAVHPRPTVAQHVKAEPSLLVTDAAGNKNVGCRTCHDPHGGGQPAHLARVEPHVPTQQLCLCCHVDKEYVKYTKHSAERLAQFGFGVDSCQPCHAMHADAAGAWGQMLSPRFLAPYCTAVEDAGASCVPCVACHRPDGPAPVRDVATHPEMIMLNIVEPGGPGYLPLFNADGREDPGGQVMCRTCHVSHGRLDLLKRLAQNPAMSPEEQHALRAQVRPFVEPNVCTACHGEEARNEFLRFHDVQWREQQRAARATEAPSPTR